jgi:hypothetical protein
MAAGIRATAKLIILPCKEIVSTGKLVPNGVPFIAPYNPTNFSFSSASDIVEMKSSKKEISPILDLGAQAKTLNLEFFLDGTGASPPLGLPTASAFGTLGNALASATGQSISAINAEAVARAATSSVAVTAWINYFFGIMAKLKSPLSVKKTMNLNFKKTDPEAHEARPVKLIWGAGLFFNCKLQSATVNYKLFNQLGLPLRATINASFIEWTKSPAAKGADKTGSPDLSKIHVVKAGDTIYNLAKQEYDDESYYIKIAEANDLKNYRRLIPGQELILPPIEKVEEE